MRAILFILILAVVALLIAIATGFLSITQTQTATAPNVDVSASGVNVAGGRPPAFDVETGSVAVGTRTTNLPALKVVPPENETGQAAGNTTNAS